MTKNEELLRDYARALLDFINGEGSEGRMEELKKQVLEQMNKANVNDKRLERLEYIVAKVVRTVEDEVKPCSCGHDVSCEHGW